MDLVNLLGLTARLAVDGEPSPCTSNFLTSLMTSLTGAERVGLPWLLHHGAVWWGTQQERARLVASNIVDLQWMG